MCYGPLRVAPEGPCTRPEIANRFGPRAVLFSGLSAVARPSPILTTDSCLLAPSPAPSGELCGVRYIRRGLRGSVHRDLPPLARGVSPIKRLGGGKACTPPRTRGGRSWAANGGRPCLWIVTCSAARANCLYRSCKPWLAASAKPTAGDWREPSPHKEQESAAPLKCGKPIAQDAAPVGKLRAFRIASN